MHRGWGWGALLASLMVVTWCDEGGGEAEVIDAEPEGEGVAFDEENPYADVEGKADSPITYEIPTDLPELERPEVIVSLDQKTVHLFDRTTGFSAVYPTGPGKLGSSGRSFTPVGFYATGPNLYDAWYYIPRRYAPDYFGGFPFLRLTIPNSQGAHTYGFHGPISYTCPSGGSTCDLEDRQWFLLRDFVSQGCMRMESDDIVEMFWLLADHASVPVSIQYAPERDANGNLVDLGTDVALWDVGASIAYGECGERPDPYESGWTSSRCG